MEIRTSYFPVRNFVYMCINTNGRRDDVEDDGRDSRF